MAVILANKVKVAATSRSLMHFRRVTLSVSAAQNTKRLHCVKKRLCRVPTGIAMKFRGLGQVFFWTSNLSGRERWINIFGAQPDRKIGLMKQQGLCHLKCSKWEQSKQSDWSDLIGWANQAIWLVQLLSLCNGFEKYFCFRVTKVLLLKSPLKLLCYYVGSSLIDGKSREVCAGRNPCNLLPPKVGAVTRVKASMMGISDMAGGSTQWGRGRLESLAVVDGCLSFPRNLLPV